MLAAARDRRLDDGDQQLGLQAPLLFALTGTAPLSVAEEGVERGLPAGFLPAHLRTTLAVKSRTSDKVGIKTPLMNLH